MNTYQTDVIIVGAGPIGLSMAKALMGTGLQVALVERQSKERIATPAPDGREIAITHHTKSLLQNWHIWQRFADGDINQLKKAEVYNGNSAFVLGFDKPKAVRGKPIETLGYLVSNYLIRQKTYEATSAHFGKNISTYFEHEVTQSTTTSTYTSLNLKNIQTGETVVLRARLVIGADSRMSFMRKMMGIPTDMHDFGRTVLVFRTEHDKSNQGIAHEGFYYGKTLAVLPLGEYRSSMVITANNQYAKKLQALDGDGLTAHLMQWLDGRLGTMRVTSEVFSYPLLGVHARRFYGTRFALIGDAAVGMHPVTAHGYNLGVESVALLAEQIINAHQAGKDIANQAHLRHYSHTHSLKTRVMYHGTNTIVGLYTDESASAKLARHGALRVAQGLLPIKKLITGQLTG